MVRAAALIALLFQIDPVLDEKVLEWASQHAPYGMDITPDGEIWISLAPSGQKNDYGLNARGLMDADPRYPKVWMRGYHLKNSDVPFRSTKALWRFNCQTDSLGIEVEYSYDASGEILKTVKNPAAIYTPEAAVPGSLGARALKVACKKD